MEAQPPRHSSARVTAAPKLAPALAYENREGERQAKNTLYLILPTVLALQPWRGLLLSAIFISIQRFVDANTSGYFIIKFGHLLPYPNLESYLSCQAYTRRERSANSLI